MSTAENKRIVADAFANLSGSRPDLFYDALADDCVWIIEGASRLSGRVETKARIKGLMMPALFANFATPYRNMPEEFIAEGDRVVVLARGQARTVRGEDYVNRYCFVIRMRDGKMVEVREFMDTAHAEARLTVGPGRRGQTKAAAR